MDTIQKLYYTIGEVSRMTELSPSKIRFWEKEIKALNPKKTSRGNRSYIQKDIDIINQIKYLIDEKGMKLVAVNKRMSQKKNPNVLSNYEIIEKLTEIKSFLNSLKSQNR